MAQTTTNYSLLKPESTDNYNHLIYDNPNMDTIDSVMKTNSNTGITPATCVKSGTVHTITRTNTSCPVFRFTATGDWNTGDTMTVDGTPVSVFMPNGRSVIEGAYIINTEVIASIVGSRVTLMSNAAEAADVAYNNTDVASYLTNLDATQVEYAPGVNVKDKIDSINTRIRIRGVLPVLALFNGKYSVNLPTDGNKTFTSVTANVSTLNADIYGTISAIGDPNVSLAASIQNNTVALMFTPSVTLSDYTAYGKGFMTQINTEIILTLS